MVRLNRPFFAVFICVLGVYALSFAAMPSDGFFINDNGTKFIQTEGMIQSGYQSMAIPWPGWDADPDHQFGPLPKPFGQLHDGNLYGFYSQTFAWVSSHCYRLLGFSGLYLLPLLSLALLLPLVWSMAGLLAESQVTRVIAVLIVSFCTPVWFYSLTFWEHMPATMLMVASVHCFLRHDRTGRPALLLGSAMACGLAIYFRDDLYVFAACLAAFLAWRRPRGGFDPLLFSAGVAAVLTPLWIWQWQEFGNPIGLRLSSATGSAWSLQSHLAGRVEVFRVLLLNAHQSLPLSIVAMAPFVALFIWRPSSSLERHPGAIAALAAAGLIAAAIVGLGHEASDRPISWLLTSNALFAASPCLIFALIDLRKQDVDSQQRSTARLLALLTLTYTAAYGVLTPAGNVAGLHWGCRLLLPIYPLLAVLAASSLGTWWPRAMKQRLTAALVAALLLASLAAQLYSLHLLQERKLFNARLNRVVAERPEQAVAAVGWFVPQELGTSFYKKSIFMVRDLAHLPELLAHLGRSNYARVLVVSNRPLPQQLSRDAVVLGDDLNFVLLQLSSVSTRAFE